MDIISNGIEFVGNVFSQFWGFALTYPCIGIPLYIGAVGAVISLLMWFVYSISGIGGGKMPPRDKRKE